MWWLVIALNWIILHGCLNVGGKHNYFFQLWKLLLSLGFVKEYFWIFSKLGSCWLLSLKIFFFLAPNAWEGPWYLGKVGRFSTAKLVPWRHQGTLQDTFVKWNELKSYSLSSMTRGSHCPEGRGSPWCHVCVLCLRIICSELKTFASWDGFTDLT